MVLLNSVGGFSARRASSRSSGLMSLVALMSPCLFGLPISADAAGECGSPNPAGIVTCNSGGAYTGGITYAVTGSDQLLLTLDNSGIDVTGSVMVTGDTGSTGNLDIKANVFDTIAATADNVNPIDVHTLGTGGVSANLKGGEITATGRSSRGIYAAVLNENSVAPVNVTVTGGSIEVQGGVNSSSGLNPAAIFIENYGKGDVNLTIDESDGPVSLTNDNGAGVIVSNTDQGNVNVTVSGGTITGSNGGPALAVR